MTDIDRRAILAGASLIGAAALARVAKADLTPPSGPIKATGRALKDIEPRRPITEFAAPPGSPYLYIISESCSCFLNGDIDVPAGQRGILVAAPSGSVCIDGEDFTIRGTSGGLGALTVATPGCDYLSICDLHVRDFDGDGIDSGGARVMECCDVHVDHCAQGIVVRNTGLLDCCHVERCSSHGIAWVKSAGSSCVFVCDDGECRQCGGHGIAMFCDCSQGDCTFCVCDCDCVSNGQDGIHLDCVAPGGSAGASCTGSLSDCRCVSNSGFGSRASTAGSPRCVMQVADCCNNSNALGGMRCFSLTCDVMDVTCCDNGGHGLWLDACSGSSCECCVTCRNGVANGSSGVFISKGTRNSVCECSSHSNGAHGVCLDQQCVSVCVTECDCSGNLTSGFTLQSPSCSALWNTASGSPQNFAVNPSAPVAVITGADITTSTNPHCNYSFT